MSVSDEVSLWLHLTSIPMSFVSVEHPTEPSANILFNSDELVFITTEKDDMSGKPTIGFVFKGDRKSVAFIYATVEDRDAVYESIVKAFKPYKAYEKQVSY